MGCLRSAPTYIYRHNSSYIFRITTPSDIITHINKKEFRYSLRTGSLSVAKFRARVIVSMVQRLFKDIRRGGRMAEADGPVTPKGEQICGKVTNNLSVEN